MLRAPFSATILAGVPAGSALALALAPDCDCALPAVGELRASWCRRSRPLGRCPWNVCRKRGKPKNGGPLARLPV
jgi:hypothetical protein